MKKAIFAAMIFSAMISCENHEETETTKLNKVETEMTEAPINLVGKTLEYDYGDNVYQVSIKSENELHWKCIKGDENGKEADETYAVQRLNNQSFFISWVEADGLGVSQVINFEEKTVHCYLKIDKEIIPLLGTIREL